VTITQVAVLTEIETWLTVAYVYNEFMQYRLTEPMMESTVNMVQQRWLYSFADGYWNSSIFVCDQPHVPHDKRAIEHLSKNR